jgi:hypothetical protein
MDNDLQELKEVIFGMLSAIAGLTAKILELEENQKKTGMYEVYTNSKIKESFNKKEEK